VQDLNYEELPESVELEANLSYVKARCKAVGELLQTLHDFKPNIEKFSLNPIGYHLLVDHLSEELLRTDTEKQVLENDVAKAKFLETPHERTRS
jgi:hypothetical protein